MPIGTAGNSRKRKPARAGFLIILLILVFFGVKAAGIFSEKPAPPAETEVSLPTETEPEETEPPETEPVLVDPVTLREIDWEGLKKRNPDVAAWIYVPGTPIDYPVMWKEADNDYYNRRDIDRTPGSWRGVYLDGDDAPDMSRLHNLFYGHHMKDGTMFTAVCDFKDEAFFREHDRLYLYTPEHVFILKPAACLYADGIPERRRTFFRDRPDFDHYVDWMTSGCSFRDLPEEGVNQLFTFVTCSYEMGHESRTLLMCSEITADGKQVPRAPVRRLRLPYWAEDLRINTERMLREVREAGAESGSRDGSETGTERKKTKT